MPKLQLVELYDIAGAQGAVDNPANLLTPDPKEVMTATVAQNIHFDLGSARQVDFIYIGGTNAAGAASFETYSSTGLNATGVVTAFAPGKVIREADAKTVRAQNFVKAAPVTSRYWTVTVSAAMQIGIIAFGKAFESDWDIEFGAGRRLVDTAKVTPLIGGGFGTQSGSRKAAYSWTFGDLTEAETETIWGMSLRRGIGKPMAVVEPYAVAAGLNERLHYGLVRQFEQFERRDPAATKWSLELEEWV